MRRGPKLLFRGSRLFVTSSSRTRLNTCQQTARGVRVQAGTSLRLPEARALAARAVAATVEYAGAQDAETLTLAMRVRLRAP